MVNKKRGQVWVETVTYTLIAFVMIGLVLSFAKPKIEEMQDKVVLEQSVRMLKDIDNIIQEVGEGQIGNKRKLEVNLKKGTLEISPSTNSLIFKMESRYLYSEPGQEYTEGNLNILTTEMGKYNKVEINMSYEGDYNLTYKDETTSKTITKSSTAYNLFISKKGGIPLDTINFEIE